MTRRVYHKVRSLFLCPQLAFNSNVFFLHSCDCSISGHPMSRNMDVTKVLLFLILQLISMFKAFRQNGLKHHNINKIKIFYLMGSDIGEYDILRKGHSSVTS